jgi:hypothetical protein
MSLELPARVSKTLTKIQKTPAIAVIFDGIDEVFTSSPVYYYNVLDNDLLLDNGLLFDTYSILIDQVTAITFKSGSSSTTTKIDLKIDPDLGLGDTITSMKIAFVDDKKNTILSYFQANEFLGKKVRVKMVPDVYGVLYPQDYITIFRGIVDEVIYESGTYQFSISHPDQKKRQVIFVEHKAELTEALDNSETTISVDNASGFYLPITGPDGNQDSSFAQYIRIEDEVISFTGVSGNDLTGCVRGALGTSAVSHDDETEVSSFYTLSGNCMDLALKIMLSGWNGPFVEDVEITNILATDTLYFESRNLVDEFGLTAGDYITTTGASNGANNVTLKVITTVDYDDTSNSTTLTVAGVTFVEEEGTAAVVDFRSRYDTLPSGLRMSPDEVDVDEHERLKSVFLTSVNYEFYLKSTIENGKDFLNSEVYQPIACYSVPKNTRASVGYTVPPLPDEQLITINSNKVKDPQKIKHMRQIGRNFYNAILYKYNEDVREEEFNSGYFLTSAESVARIPIGNKTFTIESKGLRAENVVTTAAERRLFRYKFAASQIQNLKTTFGDGFSIDIGNNVYIDSASLMIPDINSGATNFGTRLFQVIQKSLDLKTGDVTLTVLDTNFSGDARYGYISPASEISAVTDDKTFTIQTSYSATEAEYLKWSRFAGAVVQIRNDDFSISATGVLKTIGTDNVIRLVDDLAITPTVGMTMEFADYDIQTSDAVKLLYTHITNGSADFGDGGSPYYMI